MMKKVFTVLKQVELQPFLKCYKIGIEKKIDFNFIWVQLYITDNLSEAPRGRET